MQTHRPALRANCIPINQSMQCNQSINESIGRSVGQSISQQINHQSIVLSRQHSAWQYNNADTGKAARKHELHGRLCVQHDPTAGVACRLTGDAARRHSLGFGGAQREAPLLVDDLQHVGRRLAAGSLAASRRPGQQDLGRHVVVARIVARHRTRRKLLRRRVRLHLIADIQRAVQDA